MKGTPWDRGLKVTADADGLVGHAGGMILREMADRSGLTGALKDALARDGRFPEVDRGVAMLSAAVMIALGGRSMSGIAVLDHLAPVLGEPVTWQTLRRTLDLADPATLGKIAQARARIRAHVRDLIAAQPGGFPWPEIAGRTLAGWTVIDMDATLITAHSPKERATATYNRIRLPSARELVREHRRVPGDGAAAGNAGSNTASDHVSGLSAALAQVPAGYRRNVIVRLDGAGASHEFIGGTIRRKIPEEEWKPGVRRTRTRKTIPTSRRSPGR